MGLPLFLLSVEVKTTHFYLQNWPPEGSVCHCCFRLHTLILYQNLLSCKINFFLVVTLFLCILHIFLYIWRQSLMRMIINSMHFFSFQSRLASFVRRCTAVWRTLRLYIKSLLSLLKLLGFRGLSKPIIC